MEICAGQVRLAQVYGLQGNYRKPSELWRRIERMIVEEDWSPAQIAGVLTNFLIMEKLTQGRKAAPLAKAVARLLFPYRNNLHTITTDSGCEFVALLEITRRLGMKGRGKVIVYFIDSYCSWQKGAIENANKLVRKCIHQKANFDGFPDKKTMRMQMRLNRRPRGKLNFPSPKECFSNKRANFAFAVGLYRWQRYNFLLFLYVSNVSSTNCYSGLFVSRRRTLYVKSADSLLLNVGC